MQRAHPQSVVFRIVLPRTAWRFIVVRTRYVSPCEWCVRRTWSWHEGAFWKAKNGKCRGCCHFNRIDNNDGTWSMSDRWIDGRGIEVREKGIHPFVSIDKAADYYKEFCRGKYA